jgi:hypothetical protein
MADTLPLWAPLVSLAFAAATAWFLSRAGEL